MRPAGATPHSGPTAAHSHVVSPCQEVHKLNQRLSTEEGRKAKASSEADATVRRLQDELAQLRASLLQKVRRFRQGCRCAPLDVHCRGCAP